MQNNPNTTPVKTGTNPSWWNDSHNSAWDRTKDAMRRDWEQTRHDFGSTHARDLDQDVDNTVKQAVGAERIPAGNQPNRDDDWSAHEPAVRYGYGAYGQYGRENDREVQWGDSVEGKLKQEWSDLKHGRTWDEAKDAVRRGWDSARRKV